MPRTLCSHVGPYLLVIAEYLSKIFMYLYHVDQGQGGAQSIEDGAAIGVMFSRLPQISKDCQADLDAEIARRLSAFEHVRKARASIMQIYSNAGQDEAEKIRDEAVRFLGPGVKVPSQYLRCHYCFGVRAANE